MSLLWIFIIFVVLVIVFILLSRVNWDEVATSAVKNYQDAKLVRQDIETGYRAPALAAVKPPVTVVYQELKKPAPVPEPSKSDTRVFENVIEAYGSTYSSDDSSTSASISFIEPSLLSEDNDRSLVMAPGNYARSFTDVQEKDSHGETKCRQALEKMIGKPFPNVRPKFLVNPKTGALLELDCYNAELKLAVEYNGEQHYRFLKFFHRSQADFEEQQYRDEIKRQICRNRGITLITVPYTVRMDEIPQYIEDRIPKNMFSRAVSY